MDGIKGTVILCVDGKSNQPAPHGTFPSVRIDLWIGVGCKRLVVHWEVAILGTFQMGRFEGTPFFKVGLKGNKQSP